MPSPVPCPLRREFLTIEEYQRFTFASPLGTEFATSDAKSCDDWRNDSVATFSTFVESVSSETTKQVQFAEDKNGRVACQRVYNSEPLTPDEIASAWYTQDELGELRSNCRNESTASYRTEYQSHYMRLYHACDDSAKQRDDHVQLLQEGAKSAVVVAKSEYRGYERGLYHGNMRRSRKECVSSVLDAQDDFWEHNELPEEELTQHLASISRRMTKRSRRIAFLIGFGDSIAAETAYANR